MTDQENIDQLIVKEWLDFTPVDVFRLNNRSSCKALICGISIKILFGRIHPANLQNFFDSIKN